MMRTKEKLALALEVAGAPSAMIERARAGYYDDFESPLPFPLIQLVADARDGGLFEIAERTVAGEFDATREEAEAWWNGEGKTWWDALREEQERAREDRP